MIIVIPAAGQGSRFAHQRYTAPKPFIEICKRPMIHHVFDNFLNSWQPDLRFDVITRDFPQTLYLESISPGYNLASVTTGLLTAGTAKSLLAAGHLVAGDEPVVVANRDQLTVDLASLKQFLENVANKQSSILRFKCSDASNKRSYVQKITSQILLNLSAKKSRFLKRHVPAFLALLREPVTTVSIAENDMVGLGTPEDLQAFINCQ